MHARVPGELPEAVPADLARMVERARRDWLAAQNEFDFVTDPDLVDHAIYAMQAAERRYVYLLRLAAAQAASRTGPARPVAPALPPAPADRSRSA